MVFEDDKTLGIEAKFPRSKLIAISDWLEERNYNVMILGVGFFDYTFAKLNVKNDALETVMIGNFMEEPSKDYIRDLKAISELLESVGAETRILKQFKTESIQRGLTCNDLINVFTACSEDFQIKSDYYLK